MDMDINGAVKALEIVANGHLNELRSAKYSMRLPRHDTKEVELYGSKIEDTAGHSSLVLAEIYCQLALPHFFRPSHQHFLWYTPQHSPYPGRQFPWAKGLGDIVIST